MPYFYDHMAEMGMTQDRIALSELEGVFVHENITRSVCEHFIPDGQKIYDILNRYSAIVSLAYDDKERRGISVFLAPIFAAYGVTDYKILQYVRERLKLSPGAEECGTYMNSIMPFFVNTELFGSAASLISEKIGVNDQQVDYSLMETDGHKLSNADCVMIRRESQNISRMRINPKSTVAMLVQDLDANDILIYKVVSDIYSARLGPAAEELMGDCPAMDISTKGFRVLDIRRDMQLDLDRFLYVGGSYSDCVIMDQVRNQGGLQLQYNGDAMALSAADIQVLDEDCSTLSFLQSVFFDRGPQGVLDLAENWTEENLRSDDFPDLTLRDNFLKRHPNGLPEVKTIDDSNLDEFAIKSENFRKELEKKQVQANPVVPIDYTERYV